MTFIYVEHLATSPQRSNPHQHELMRRPPGAQVGCIAEQLDGVGDVGGHAVTALQVGVAGKRKRAVLMHRSAAQGGLGLSNATV